MGGKMEEMLLFWVVGWGFVVFPAGSSRTLRMGIEPEERSHGPEQPDLPMPPHNLGTTPTICNSPHPVSDPGTLAPCPPHSVAHSDSPRLHPPHSDALSFLASQVGRANASCHHTVPELGAPCLFFKKYSETKLPRAPYGAEGYVLGGWKPVLSNSWHSPRGAVQATLEM